MSLKTSKRRIQNGLTNLLEIPRDIVLDLPRITLLGSMQALIENHKGIIEYNSEQVRIRLNKGELLIWGENLVLGNLQAEEILIEGTVLGLKFDR